MHNGKITFIAGFLLAFATAFAAAGQDLPKISQTSSIKSGTLPNRVSYYLAPNNSSKGYANFVLVQKGNSNTDRSRQLLTDLPHFRKTPPYKFLASKGIGYGPDGLVSTRDGNTVFTFKDVPMFDSAASDSTLLLVFDLIQEYGGEQAVIICGDFNQSEMEGELRIFSLNVTPRGKRPFKDKYKWEPSVGPVVVHTRNNTRNIATLTCSWTSPRTPHNRLQTPQPLVERVYAGALQNVVEKRILRRFIKEGIPLAGLRSYYTDSANSSGDEKYGFSVSVNIDDLEMAAISMASIFAELDTKGAYQEEYQDAKMAVLTSESKSAGIPESNASIAEKCISAYLYGTNLASAEAAVGFFSRRQMTPARELSLFNNFVAALLDLDRGIEIRFDTPAGDFDANAILGTFRSAWEIAAASPVQSDMYRRNYGDTLSLLAPKRGKVKIKSTAKDPVTSGSTWTFSNGTRVIFRKTDQKGLVNYGLLLKGGYSYVPGIGPGESSFVGDVLELFSVGGMNAMNFRNMLEANGIEMKGKASLTGMQLVGSAPSDKMELLMKVLLSYSRDRQPDTTAFAYYRKCEQLRQERFRLSNDGIIAAIDSTMCPDYYFPATKSIDKLRDDLPERVDEYLDRQFSKFSDGLLVILGDLDENALKEMLCRYLGNFTVSSDFSVRPKVEYNLRPGWSTYMVEASHSSVGSGEVCVNVGMATRQPFTIRNYCAFMIASVALKSAITDALAPMGVYAEFSVDAQVFPAERLAFYVTCRPCAEDGLPAGIVPAEPMDVLRALRTGISRASRGKLTDAELKGLKSALSNSMATQVSQPGFVIPAVMMRNSEGKDIVTNYSTAIGDVTSAEVMKILHDLDFGSKVEYIIR